MSEPVAASDDLHLELQHLRAEVRELAAIVHQLRADVLALRPIPEETETIEELIERIGSHNVNIADLLGESPEDDRRDR